MMAGHVWTRGCHEPKRRSRPALLSWPGPGPARYLARVVAWDVEVGADDPIDVTLDLIALNPEVEVGHWPATTPPDDGRLPQDCLPDRQGRSSPSVV